MQRDPEFARNRYAPRSDVDFARLDPTVRAKARNVPLEDREVYQDLTGWPYQQDYWVHDLSGPVTTKRAVPTALVYDHVLRRQRYHTLEERFANGEGRPTDKGAMQYDLGDANGHNPNLVKPLELMSHLGGGRILKDTVRAETLSDVQQQGLSTGYM